jgi:hypothetical protein
MRLAKAAPHTELLDQTIAFKADQVRANCAFG